MNALHSTETDSLKKRNHRTHKSFNMKKSNTWVVLIVANLIGLASAAYFVSISGELAGVIPALMVILVLDIQACSKLLKQST